MDEINIPFSKKKLSIEIKGSIVFVLLGLYLYSEMAGQLSISYAFFVGGIGLIGILFFTWITYHAIKKIVGKHPGLIINQQGIIDQSNATSVGFTPWSDIVEIKTGKFISARTILIYIRDPYKIIESQGGLKKKLLELNMKIFKTPLSIITHTLESDHDVLESLLISNLQKHHERFAFV